MTTETYRSIVTDIDNEHLEKVHRIFELIAALKNEDLGESAEQLLADNLTATTLKFSVNGLRNRFVVIGRCRDGVLWGFLRRDEEFTPQSKPIDGEDITYFATYYAGLEGGTEPTGRIEILRILVDSELPKELGNVFFGGETVID